MKTAFAQLDTHNLVQGFPLRFDLGYFRVGSRASMGRTDKPPAT
jgi:hypothetical protein